MERYSGRDPFLPILLAVRGTIYDVSKGKDFYGPGAAFSAGPLNQAATCPKGRKEGRAC